MRNLSEFPFKEKNEILDWSCIPPGECDMNFRPPSTHPTGDVRHFVVYLVVVAMIAGLSGLVLRYLIGPLLNYPVVLGLVVVAGVILALVDLLGGSQILPAAFVRLPRRCPLDDGPSGGTRRNHETLASPVATAILGVFDGSG